MLQELSTDYINANWISAFGRRHAYIACQGPVPDSLAHFWYMVWQANVREECLNVIRQMKAQLNER